MDRGATMPLFGRTQYFFGLVVLTYSRNVARISAPALPFSRNYRVYIAFARGIHENDSFYLERDLLVCLVGQLQLARDLLI